MRVGMQSQQSAGIPIFVNRIPSGRSFCALQLKLMFGALTRAAERWRSVKVTDFERRQIAAIRKELDAEYEPHIGTHISSKDAPVIKKSSKKRT
jgi:hypothetical protein